MNIAKNVADEYKKNYGVYTYFIIVCIRHLGPEKALEAAKFASNVKAKNVVGFGMAGDEKNSKHLISQKALTTLERQGSG